MSETVDSDAVPIMQRGGRHIRIGMHIRESGMGGRMDSLRTLIERHHHHQVARLFSLAFLVVAWCLAILVGVLLPVSPVHAESPQRGKGLDRKWADATMHADGTTLNQLLADDLTYTHTGGNTQTKAQFIDSVTKGQIRYESIEFEQQNARVYGNTIVTTSRLRVTLNLDGGEVSLHPCFLHVWIKNKGRWQLVAHQATKIE
jgi:ketosteroid isomerase-like protein